MDRVPRAERTTRVAKTLDLVGLSGMGKRRVSELSGGQQQRAALARAIIKEPAVLLLDEPFGALDLKLRHQLQEEVVRLKELTGTTFVHVTHDQEEACAVADRIAVMRDGKIVQVDTPLALYRTPRTAYVADFIHAGTIVRGEVHRENRTVRIAHRDLVLTGTLPPGIDPGAGLAALLPRDSVHVLPENARADDGASVQADGIVQRMTFTGSVFDLHVRIGSTLEVRVTASPDEVASIGADRLHVGRTVRLAWRPDAVVILEDN
jgi:ABC-type Fe3+/spermidine/putrescine transport system ATPase subunit